MRDNLDDEQKEHLEIKKNKRNKAKWDNLKVNEKEQLRKYMKKGKKVMHENLNNEKIEHINIEYSKRKQKQSVTTLIIMKKNS